VWSLADNRLACDLPIEGPATPLFSPDGRWLATGSGDGLKLWKVGAWEPGPKVPDGHPIFPPAGGLIGVYNLSVVTLFDPDGGRTVATLEDPNQDRADWVGFSPDGTRLGFSTHDSYSVHVWDLPRVRAGLKAIDLDWDAPDYPPRPPAAAPLRPFKVLLGGQPLPQPETPLVVLSAPGARPRPATPEQIAGWVKQLADRDEKTRAGAEKALEEVGPPALKALDEADVAGRERARQVRDRIEVARALTPRRFTLKFKEAPVAEAIQALADQANVRLSHGRLPFGDDPGAKVTLDLADVPFLEALDRLCAAAGLVALPAGTGWSLVEGKAPGASNPVAYGGPLRLEARTIQYSRQVTFQGDKAAAEQLLLHLSLTREGGASVDRHAGPRVIEATDDAGHSLRPVAAPGGEVFSPFGLPTLSVALRPPAGRGGMLKTLKLALPVEVAARRQNVLTVPDFTHAAGRSFSAAAGVRLKVQRVNEFAPNNIQIQLAVSAPEGRDLDPTALGMRWTDAGGRDHEVSNFRLNNVSQSVREAEGDDFLWLGAAPQAAFPGALPWAALAPRGRPPTRRQWTGFAQVNAADAGDLPARLTLYRFERLRTEVPFEFRDLPLP
jgi:hypothetical protein